MSKPRCEHVYQGHSGGTSCVKCGHVLEPAAFSTGPTGDRKNCGQSHPVHGERCYRPLGHTGMHHAMDDDGAVWKWNEHMFSDPTGEKQEGVVRGRLYKASTKYANQPGRIVIHHDLVEGPEWFRYGINDPVTVYREDSGKVLVDPMDLEREVLDFAAQIEANVEPSRPLLSKVRAFVAALTSSPGEESEAG